MREVSLKRNFENWKIYFVDRETQTDKLTIVPNQNIGEVLKVMNFSESAEPISIWFEVGAGG